MLQAYQSPRDRLQATLESQISSGAIEQTDATALSTALDDIDEATLGTRPSMGHVTAREEVTSLLRQLKLPLDERGRRRAANRAEWFTQVDKPLEIHDIISA